MGHNDRRTWTLLSLVTWVCTVGAVAAASPANTIPPEVHEINHLVRKLWDDHDLALSPNAEHGEWCRRVYLDVIGRIPTVDELDVFLRSTNRDKKSQLVHTLLYSHKYISEYARNWTTIWTNLLIGRRGGTEANSLTNREGLRSYLTDVFYYNQRYDSFVFELVSACGSNAPGSENFDGSVNFLTAKLADKATQATAQTAQLFLGLRVQCTQCHNHPFNDRKQSQFWELNAFFRQAVALRRFDQQSSMLREVELTDQDFGGESGTPDEAELFYELRNGTLATAYPVFVDGTELENKSGFLSDVNRRQELARLMAKSNYLPRAITNRMWGHFLGHGFTTPVDDMGPHNVPSHPQLLDYLAHQFAQKDFDLKQLITWIVLSRPYAVSSRVTAKNTTDSPSRGEPPKFSHFYLRQMRPEELYESMLVASNVDKSDRADHQRAQREWLRQLTIAFGTDEGDETTTFNGTVTQTLLLFNGSLVKQATSDHPGGFLHRTAQHPRPFAQKIDHLFLTALSREATVKEQQMARRLRTARQGDELATLQDVWWAILNTNEFILNH